MLNFALLRIDPSFTKNDRYVLKFNKNRAPELDLFDSFCELIGGRIIHRTRLVSLVISRLEASFEQQSTRNINSNTKPQDDNLYF